MITGPEAGITRDAIASKAEWAGRPLRLFDTAGLRRKVRVEGKAEELSVGDTLKAIRFAEVVVLLLDAENPFEKQDLQIADLIAQEGRALVIAVNKWDLIRERAARLAELREMCQRLLPQVKGVALVTISALSGKGLDRLMDAVLAADEVWNRRLPTHLLNQWLGAAVDAHPPPAVSGRRIKLRYMTQANARPPTFVVFCSQPKALPESYVRYLVNGLREGFDLPGVPIRLNLRKGENPYVKGRRT
jgi:GTP-binding protein